MKGIPISLKVSNHNGEQKKKKAISVDNSRRVTHRDGLTMMIIMIDLHLQKRSTPGRHGQLETLNLELGTLNPKL